MNQKDMNDEMEIDLLDLAYMLMDHWHHLLLCLLAGALALNAFAFFFIEPTYESTAKLYVVSTSDDSVVNLNDLNLGTSLTSDYEELMFSYPVLNRVIEKLKLDMDYEDLAKLYTLNNPSDTRVLQITATTTDPQLSMDLAETMAEEAVSYLPDTMSTKAPNIAQHAKLPEHKAAPSYFKFTVIGGLLGLLICAGILIVRYLMDDTIHTAEEMEKYFGLVPLTTIPESSKVKSYDGEEEYSSRKGEREMNKLKVVFPDLPYAVEEAMNRLRINVKFCGKNTKKILLTSCMPNEGKSTVSSYLWKMLAEAGFSTVMVDVDLRKSVQMQRMQVENASETKGLNHYLSGMAEYEDVVYKTNIENAYIVPCTQLLENPSPLLEDARFRELLDRLAGEYRFVIVDTPPLGSVSDGALIASLCDGAILVVRAGQTPKAMIKQSLYEIEQSGCKLLGTVLNRAEVSTRGYGKYGKYGNYGYGYGYEPDTKHKKHSEK